MADVLTGANDPRLRAAAESRAEAPPGQAAAASAPADEPAVRRIGVSDLRDALAEGWRDFLDAPTQLVFLAVIYPVVGLAMATGAAGGHLMSVVWPLVAGFALVGPLAALAIYEISRRRERGLPASLRAALGGVARAPGLGSIVLLGLALLAVFAAWIAVAEVIYFATIGDERYPPPASATDLAGRVFGTGDGLTLLLLGNGVGFLFAALVLATTVVSFPLLLERDVGAAGAVRTSLRAVAANPVPMALWGLAVAALLLLGSLPLFVGLAVVLPVLGHATWRLYRRVVVPAG